MKTATPVPAPGTESVVFYFDYNGRHKQHQRKLDGIRRYAKARAWQVLALSPEESKPGDVRALLARHPPVGCIVERSLLYEDLPPALFGKIPVVYLDPQERMSRRAAPAVVCDDRAVAHAAFRELSSGLPPAYAVVTYRMPRQWARDRVAAFCALCRRARRDCHVFPERDEAEEGVAARAERLARWAATLPRNCAVFAVNDYTAGEMARAFRAAARPLPFSATLIGVDGDHNLAGDDGPRLSTVKLDFEHAGFLAAKMLGEIISHQWEKRATCDKRQAVRIMPAEKPKSRFACRSSHVACPMKSASDIAVIEPLLVLRRDSTRGRGRREPFVMEAVEFIRREAADGLTAADLAARFRCSRNLFERRFREAMGHSVLDEILHVRLERAQVLLARADMKIGAIASFSGFKTERELQKLFRIRMGMSMRQWRKSYL